MRKLTHVYLKKVFPTFLFLLAISFTTVISSVQAKNSIHFNHSLSVDGKSSNTSELAIVALTGITLEKLSQIFSLRKYSFIGTKNIPNSHMLNQTISNSEIQLWLKSHSLFLIQYDYCGNDITTINSSYFSRRNRVNSSELIAETL